VRASTVATATAFAAGTLLASAVAAQGPTARPVEAAVDRTILADTLFFPEGLDADLRDGTLYVSSLRYRNVLVVPSDAAHAAHWLLTPGGTPHGSVFGVAIDTSSATAWLSAAPTPHMLPTAADGNVGAELLRVALDRGTITGRWTLGDGTGTPGEIALTPRGDVLVSDGTRGRLYRLRAGSAVLEVIESAALRSPQGIAVRPDGAVAYVADWSRGILRWDLQSDELTPVPTAAGGTVRGIDGMRWWHGALLAIQNGVVPHRVLRLTLTAPGDALAGADVLDAPESPSGEGTVGVVIGERLVYVASSAWPFYTAEGVRIKPERALPPLVVREVPLAP
jgi:hypothetical protein